MNEALDDLFDAVEAFLKDASVPKQPDDDEGGDIWQNSDPIRLIAVLASAALISSDGSPNFTAMRKLSIEIPTVQVIRGEYDSFGWLSGVIVTPKGNIVYG